MNPINPGIDYSGIAGTCNRDSESGIRYGIISANDLTEWLWESVESIYLPYCPHCDDQLDDGWDDQDSQDAAGTEGISDEVFTDSELDDICDPICTRCYKVIEDGEQWPDCAEPAGNILTDSDYEGFVDDSNDVWVTKSPFYTHAQFCSPCAPGAGHLGNPCEDGPKTYCLGHDWFTGGIAPYPVYLVKDDTIVGPK